MICVEKSGFKIRTYFKWIKNCYIRMLKNKTNCIEIILTPLLNIDMISKHRSVDCAFTKFELNNKKHESFIWNKRLKNPLPFLPAPAPAPFKGNIKMLNVFAGLRICWCVFVGCLVSFAIVFLLYFNSFHFNPI